MQAISLRALNFSKLSFKENVLPHLAAALLLVVVTVAVYGSMLGHDFIRTWDDSMYVVDNPTAHGLSLPHIREAFTKVFVGNYAPVHIISYMLDFELWGLNPLGYLLTNLLIHIGNGLIWYALVFQVTRHRLWAAVAAGFFLWHPLQVESVAWISQRKTVLSLFFFLGAFQCYLSASKRTAMMRILLQICSLICFVLALLTKSVSVVLPLVLVVYDLCYQPEKKWRLIMQDKLVYFGAALLCSLVAIVSQGDYAAGGGRFPYYGGSFLITMLTMLPVYIRYLELIILPYGQSAIYAPPLKQALDYDVILAGLLILLFILSGALLWRRRRDLFFWGALICIAFLPVAQFVPLITLMNDRYCYYPLLGAGALLGAILAYIADNFSGNRMFIPAAVLFCTYGVAMPVMARSRCDVWKNQITLWRDAYEKTPIVFTGYDPDITRYKLAESYTQEARRFHVTGDYQAARLNYLRALGIDPNYHDALNDYAVLLLDQNKPSAARTYLETMTRVFPRSYRGYLNLGDCLVMAGQFVAAEKYYEKALALSPGNPKISVARGRAAEARRDFIAAARFYDEALALGTRDPEVLIRISSLDLRRGDRQTSLHRLAEALRLGFRDLRVLAGDPIFAKLENDPEFRRILVSSGLAVPEFKP